MVKKKFLLILIFGIFFISSCYSVLGVTTFVAIKPFGNYTTNLNLTLDTDFADALNVTCYYNATGGDANVEFVSGATTNITDFNITLIDIISLDSSYLYNYNITCNVSASAGATSEVVSMQNITFDSTAPNMTFYNVISDGYYKSSVNLNASITDAVLGVVNISFNLTNSAGTQVNWTVPSIAGSYYSMTLVTSAYTDGIYNLTVNANDTLNHNETIISFTLDNTVPTVSFASSSATTSSVTGTITSSDATSGISGTCTADRSGATISSSTLTETGLACGHSYSYIITCVDYAGNSASSTSVTLSTSNCGSGVTSSGTLWTGTTYLVNDNQFGEGYTKQVAVKSRMRVKVGTIYHHIGVKELTETSATIEIASDPIDVKLDVGEDAKVDVTDDGFYDIYVLLNSIVNNKADITVQKIHEEIPEGEGSVETTGEVNGGEEAEEPEETNLTWLWVIIGVLVLVAIIGGGIAVKKRRQQ